jgi:hypothetical protein
MFSSIFPPFATAHTPIGPGEIGVVVFLNTFFIVVAQIPATRVVKRIAAHTPLPRPAGYGQSPCSRSCSQR